MPSNLPLDPLPETIRWQRLPAWLLSLAAHLALAIVAAVLLRFEPPPQGDEPDRSATIILARRTAADAVYFRAVCGRDLPAGEFHALVGATIAAYRWQYIGSGAVEPRFQQVLGELTTPVQRSRIAQALEPILT